MRIASLIILTLFAAATFAHAESPTTKPSEPTTKPVAKKPAAKPDKNWTQVKNDAYKFSFFVPKTWKQIQAEQSVANFSVRSTNKEEPGWASQFVIVSAPPCHGSGSVEEQVKFEKEALAKRPNIEIVKEFAIEFASQPAWKIIYDETHTDTQYDKKGSPKENKVKVRMAKTIGVRNKIFYIVSVSAESPRFESVSKQCDRVIASIQWTDGEEQAAK